MSTFNELVLATGAACPACGAPSEIVVQFRYGDTWQHRYQVGDQVRWGGNDVGQPGRHLVVVAGYPERCEVCGDDGTILDIYVRDDVIESVKSADGTHDYVAENADFLVIEP
jgi:hypothetical protein